VDGRTAERPSPAVSTADAGADGAPGFRHGAALFDSDAALLEVALPFLEEGLAAGDLTVLSCTPGTADLVRRELGPAGRGLESDPGLIPQDNRPPDVFTLLRQYALRAAENGGGRLRVLAEVPATDDPRQAREEMRIEAAANRVMADLPVTNLCVYDSRRLPADLVAAAGSTHPHLASGAAWTANAAYREPASYVRSLPTPREPLESTPPVVRVESAATLVELRRSMTGALPGLVRDEEQLEDLRLAISEVAANAFRHGARPISGRLWSDGRQVVCEITDSGTTFDDPLAGFVPAHGYDLGRGGMGLWLARKLCDHVDIFPEPAGFTVRLITALR
jgi:anti-sigma regulatory factor (Ser/Thr protein kinase)